MNAGCPLLLFPCNGNAVEALDCLDESWDCLGFVDDAPAKWGSTVSGVRVMDRSALDRWPEARVLAVPGGPSSYLNRRAVIEGLSIEEERHAQVIHPKAIVSPHVSIGRNSLIMAGVVLTSNVVVGHHCCILPNSVVHHDSTVGDWTLIGAGVVVAGEVTIGRNCYIASGSNVMNGLDIGDEALVGLGSNVVRNVAAGTRVAGNPARELREAGARII